MAARIDLTDTHWLAWAAGIIDGEGSIGIYKNRHRNNWELRVSVGNLDPRLLRLLRELFGGHTRLSKVAKGRYRPLWKWAVSHRGAERCLRLVMPWLVAKRDQAELALEARSLVGRKWQRRSLECESALCHLDSELRRLKRVEFPAIAFTDDDEIRPARTAVESNRQLSIGDG